MNWPPNLRRHRRISLHSLSGIAQNGGMVDTLELYRWAVQDPETHAEVLRIMFESRNAAKRAVCLREDFSGTAADSVAWVALQPLRTAVAVDIDAPTVAWAKRRADRILGDRASGIQFFEADVLEIRPDRAGEADILSVLNYSIFYFYDRDGLVAYLSHARECLAAHGVIVLNFFGGADKLRPCLEGRRVEPAPRLPQETAIPPFEYFWEQAMFDPETGRLDARIHFHVPEPERPGVIQKIRNAFRYEFRVWSPAELFDALQEAGFRHVEFWRHTFDPAEGPFLGPVPMSELDPLEKWSAYLVASR